MKKSLLLLVFLSISCVSENIVVSNSDQEVNACASEVGCSEITATKRNLDNVSGFDDPSTAIYTVTTDSNNNFYIAGTVDSGGGNSGDAYITKFDTLSDTVDRSFGTDGSAVISLAQSQYFSSLYIDKTNSSIYGIGADSSSSSGGQTDIILAKFDLGQGTLDTSFNSDGKILQNYPANWYDRGYAVRTLSDGKVYSCGYAWRDATYNYDAVISRYSSLGVLDSGFASSGHLFINTGGDQSSERERCYGIYELDSGKILIYGVYYTSPGTAYQPFITRFNSDWTLDTTFASSGTLSLNFDVYSFLADERNIHIKGDMLYAFGKSKDSEGKYTGMIIKVNISTGSLDTSFGASGKLLINPGCADGDSSSIQEAKFLEKTFFLRGTCWNNTGRLIGFVTSVLKNGSQDPYFNGGNNYFLLEEKDSSGYDVPVHFTLSKSGARVYSVSKGEFDVYELKWK
jgi:uncharacterized delta-60 repeat protein